MVPRLLKKLNKKGFFGHFRDAAPVGPRLATKRPSQRHPSWETALNGRLTRHGNGNYGHCCWFRLLEPIFEEDAMEGAFLPK
jgi:hypothetical protein